MGHDKTAKADNLSQRRQMPNVMSSACTPGLNVLRPPKKPMKHGGTPLPVQGAFAEKNTWWAYLRQTFASRPTTHRWNFVKHECQTTPGGDPLPVQGAPAEKNIQLNSSAAHCYAWAVVIVVALLMTTASDHRGSVPRASCLCSRPFQ